MSCLVKKSNICSPETTVSSLLASGNFQSGRVSLSHSSVHYKDKLYSSASQALEAYIKDFNLSLSSPDVRPGKIEILPWAPENFSSSKDDFEPKCGTCVFLFNKVCGEESLPVLEVTLKIASKCQANIVLIYSFIYYIYLLIFYVTHLPISNSDNFLCSLNNFGVICISLCYIYLCVFF